MALTPKKRRFIDAIRGGASNRDAAIAAGCPEKSASAAGSRLAKDPDVVNELHKLNALHPVKGGVKPNSPPATQESPEDDPDPAGFDLGAALLHRDPKDFLLAVMNDAGSEPKLRVDAAKALMPFLHPRKGEGGKKDERQKAAEQAASKFTRQAPPRLAAANGKKV
ncbi:terminase small subunit [Pseudomonas putida]|uniref:Terminase n=1 Tax=Pseudomonas putida (strain ATCC 700007 / DSM 6899 / JCM 31910 / BCRC 17059 / LMG 24140 / F1) TaxID=351746 RepID=A5W7Y1_PSEP1|nr:terminase [Pseudomonas putida]MDD2001516.1 terminase small subunit [Pseudomonas putida]HDS1791554.1 terminase small subunit [Pseudomonas putida]